MFKRILVPLDGERRAERVLPLAARLARASDSSLVLLQVVYNPMNTSAFMYDSAVFAQEDIDAELTQAMRYLKAVSLSEDLKGVACHEVTQFGAVAPSILATIEENHIDLVVMDSHGETGVKRWMMGSVAQKIVRHSPVPVLVMRDGGPVLAEKSVRAPRALVSLDGSPLAESAIVPAAQLVAALAGKEQGTLHLVHVISMPVTKADVGPRMVERREEAHMYMSALAERLLKVDLAQYNLHITSSVVFEPDVAAALVHMAEEGDESRNIAGCDVIAMATHGRSGPQRWALGSITERTLTATKLPLLIVRPHEVGGRHAQAHKEVASIV